VSVLAPALVWYGSVATCHSRFTIIVSEFLGWLSYPLYCLHWPAFAAVRGLYADGGNGFGVPEPVAAFGAAVVLSIIVGVLIDRLGLQKKLTDLLIRITRRVAQAYA
jgi:peptidoglycan/LPS O-acetylase OafA/YrhL